MKEQEQEQELVTITVSRNNFELSKVKFDGKKVTVEGNVKMSVNGGVIQSKKINETIDSFPHPDLLGALFGMKPFLLQEWNFLFPLEIVKSFEQMKDLEKGLTKAETKILDELKIFMEDKLQEMSEKVTIT